jgi:LPXTG-motif cell wall-anchored protein
MNAKTIGIIIMVIGLVMTLYTGFNYVTRETVMDMGDVHLSMDENHSTNWSPFVGIGVIIIGGVVFLAGRKKSLS